MERKVIGSNNIVRIRLIDPFGLGLIPAGKVSDLVEGTEFKWKSDPAQLEILCVDGNYYRIQDIQRIRIDDSPSKDQKTGTTFYTEYGSITVGPDQEIPMMEIKEKYIERFYGKLQDLSDEQITGGICIPFVRCEHFRPWIKPQGPEPTETIDQIISWAAKTLTEHDLCEMKDLCVKILHNRSRDDHEILYPSKKDVLLASRFAGIQRIYQDRTPDELIEFTIHSDLPIIVNQHFAV